MWLLAGLRGSVHACKPSKLGPRQGFIEWVAVKEFKLSGPIRRYVESIWFLDYGNSIQVLYQQPSRTLLEPSLKVVSRVLPKTPPLDPPLRCWKLHNAIGGCSTQSYSKLSLLWLVIRDDGGGGGGGGGGDGADDGAHHLNGGDDDDDGGGGGGGGDSDGIYEHDDEYLVKDDYDDSVKNKCMDR